MAMAAMSNIVARIQVFNSVYIYQTGFVPMRYVKRPRVLVGYGARFAHVLGAEALHLLGASDIIMKRKAMPLSIFFLHGMK